ncbi:MAG: glycosyltransferase [Fibrobacteres bacterium]|nr:glycosyltransferase [Fibrobacterota bacterium]
MPIVHPLVSVVLPVLNGAPYIRESVNSILNQTLHDIELIVVDNGSTDNTTEILSEISDPRLSVIRECEKGVFNALNKGIKTAKGEFFARMDCDDIALPHRLEYQHKLWQSSGAEVIGGGVRPFRTDREIGNGFTRYCTWLNTLTINKDIIHNIFIEDPIPSPTLFMPLKALIKVGGYDPGVYPDDYNLTLKNYSAGYSFAKTESVLLEWRDHDGRLSRTATELKNQRFFNIKASYFKKIIYDSKRPIVIWGLGSNAKDLYRSFQKEGVPVAGFTSASEFIKEKSLYNLPISAHTDWKNCYFIIATAARDARTEVIDKLQQIGLETYNDFIAFC